MNVNAMKCHEQGPDLYAFIGFIGPDDINYMRNQININIIIKYIIKI